MLPNFLLRSPEFLSNFVGSGKNSHNSTSEKNIRVMASAQKFRELPNIWMEKVGSRIVSYAVRSIVVVCFLTKFWKLSQILAMFPIQRVTLRLLESDAFCASGYQRSPQHQP